MTMYVSAGLLLTLLSLGSAQFLPNGTWVNPPFCAYNPDVECPPYNRLDDGTTPYEIREYLEGQWACVSYSSNVPQTSDEHYIQTYDYARHAHYWILRNYTKGDNVENEEIQLNLPVITFMYYRQNANGNYLIIANEFKMCYYIPLDPAPTPNSADITIGNLPTTTYYVWQFNAPHFDAERWTDEQIAFKAALAANGVTDFDPSFHVTAGYGPYMDPLAHNEMWAQKV